MAILLALLLLVALFPLVLRIARLLLRAHLWAILLFLPAGMLLRAGPGEDLRIYFGATALWALCLVGYARHRRRRGAGGEDRPRGG